MPCPTCMHYREIKNVPAAYSDFFFLGIKSMEWSYIKSHKSQSKNIIMEILT